MSILDICPSFLYSFWILTGVYPPSQVQGRSGKLNDTGQGLHI
jgi:hypothetical protein